LGRYPGDAPYRRKIVTFKNYLDKETSADLVEVDKIGYDRSNFNKKYDPNHPAADADGYVETPNVNPIIEMVDMREARRAYEANLNVVEVTKGMLNQTISLLR
ncbi:MAG: flagellar basal body rod protein FlgC, partial [Rickettsiales bacterium]